MAPEPGITHAAPPLQAAGTAQRGVPPEFAGLALSKCEISGLALFLVLKHSAGENCCRILSPPEQSQAYEQEQEQEGTTTESVSCTCGVAVRQK